MSKRSERRASNMKLLDEKDWYSVRGVLSYSWAMFYILIGARERGKSYAVMDFFLRKWKSEGIPFVWLRLSDTSKDKLLANNACDFVDPDLYRKYKLDLTVKAGQVYDHGKKMARVLSLQGMAKDKGVALFDNEYTGWYHLALDEFQRERKERRLYDIVYNLVNELENLVRSRKEKMRIFLIGNTLEEASDIMLAFNFLPEKFGRYKLKSKRAIIDYMPNSAKYAERRKGTVADLLSGKESTFTNKTTYDRTTIYKDKLKKPTRLIYFSKDEIYTVWDNAVICEYNKENVPVTCMRPYQVHQFFPELRDNIYKLYDTRAFLYRSIIIQKRFTKALEVLRPTK